MVPSIRIDVVSDTLCPWCFVGKRRLEQAVDKFVGRAKFEIVWHPFQINPDAPQSGLDKMELLKRKFGEDRVNQMLPAMHKIFSDVGLQYRSGGLTGNSMNSHRLIAWARRHSAAVQNALVEELMLDYFTRELFINDKEVLVAAAVRAGLPACEARAVLDDPQAELANVMTEIAAASKNIGGVPFMTIDHRWQAAGAQSMETFERLIEAAICASSMNRFNEKSEDRSSSTGSPGPKVRSCDW